MAQFYAIADRKEAEAYLEDPVLRRRLVEISEALLELEACDAGDVMGWPDDMKLKSSMTLFHLVEPEEEVFRKVLEKYFGGELDRRTVEILGRD